MINILDKQNNVLVKIAISDEQCKCGNYVWKMIKCYILSNANESANSIILCSKCNIFIKNGSGIKYIINENIRRKMILWEFPLTNEKRRIEIMAEILGSKEND